MPNIFLSELHSVIAEELADNWTAFRQINALAGRSAPLDAMMIFSANDLIFLAPLLAALLWLAMARWSPYARWLAARLGGEVETRVRWITQRVALSAALAAALALGLNVLVGTLIYEPRPFVSHPGATHLLIAHAADASFPSDHEAVAMAIGLTLALNAIWLLALAARLWWRNGATWPWRQTLAFLAAPAIIGGVALAAAAMIGLARVFVGVHYPYDIIGGAGCGVIGCLIALALMPLTSHLYRPVVRLGEALRLA